MVYAKNFKISRLLLIALVIVSMVAFSCYTAPKAQAEAVTLTSVFLMLVMSVMASLGVTLLSSLLDDGLSYLQEQYGLYVSEHGFTSIEEYLITYGVTSVSKLCVPILGALNVGKTVYDLIAGFCSWFFTEEGVVSGGSYVGEAGSIPTWITPNSSSAYFIGSGWLDATHYYVDVSALPTNTGALIFFNGIDMHNQSFILSIARASGNTANGIRAGFNPNPNGNVVGTTYIYLSNPSSSFSTWSNSTSAKFFSVTGVAGSFTGRLTFDFSRYVSAGYSTGYVAPGFVVSPSSTVLSPPAVDYGQSYQVSAPGVFPTDSVDTAVSTAVAPLTTSQGLSTTATVSGTAIPDEWVWLYEGVDAIEQNTSDDRHGTDFIPNNATVDFGFWHYVPDWISSVGAGFAFFVGLVTSFPSIMLAPLYGILVLGVVVALFHKLWGS